MILIVKQYNDVFYYSLTLYNQNTKYICVLLITEI